MDRLSRRTLDAVLTLGWFTGGDSDKDQNTYRQNISLATIEKLNAIPEPVYINLKEKDLIEVTEGTPDRMPMGHRRYGYLSKMGRELYRQLKPFLGNEHTTSGFLELLQAKCGQR